MKSHRILVVDDEEDLCEILQFNLETEGYSVDISHSGEEALQRNLHEYSLLLLDVMMGEISGFKLASILRKIPESAHIPIIFLTAKDSENDKLTGFTLGADDYITKPFSIREVVARVKAVINRIDSVSKHQLSTITVIKYDKLSMNLGNMTVFLQDKEISVTKKEFEILKLFLENRNRLFSREEILTRIWNNEAYVLNRTVDVNITRLRKKIGQYEQNIVTRLGYGYCFEE
jgi:two-component system alkaline phosphatase synthesis response regulator PhoP